MESSDEILIREYIDGDERALKTLIERYTPSIYGFAARLAGSSEASDIVQDVFIKVWKNLKKFNSKKAQFKTWLFTIARNTVTDHLRKKKQVLFSDIDTTPEESFAENIRDEARLPNEIAEKLEDQNLLHTLLSNLPLEYQTVLALYYQEDMTFSQIGDVLKKSVNTVKSHHFRALKSLRKMIP